MSHISALNNHINSTNNTHISLIEKQFRKKINAGINLIQNFKDLCFCTPKDLYFKRKEE